ncbi:hypothetical protein [Saccharomonospora saliphila]|uniref:hypothetical protein n=1 Tax=Saccharomonospora saliphila TaxID=369829 RepID=UPI00037CAD81|nr:hypothetical protein [Saccharomonospora saliphila]
MRRRIDAAVAAGELAPGSDTTALAAFVNTVLYGLSIQARDGATARDLHAVIDVALKAWPREAP